MATKKDLAERLSKKLDYLSEEDAKSVIHCIINYVKDEMIKGNRVEVRGFGSLSIRKRKYADRDEQYNSVYYRMSKNIQEALNT